jgi:gamma-glutamyltranspeptidase/glutathione hydrolase
MTRIAIIVAAVAAAMLVAAPAPGAPRAGSPYELTAQALASSDATDLYLFVSGDAGAPARLDKVQVKALGFGGEPVVVRNLRDVALTDGAAFVRLEPFAAGRPIHVEAHLKDGSTAHLRARTDVVARRYGADGVVSTDHALATEVGAAILRRGGNAIDAAAAVQFALNVVHPMLTGIGGGSAVVVRLADGEEWAIDGRERAPHATTPDQYAAFAAPPAVSPRVGFNGWSVGVPATLRTVDEMLRRWGTMSLADVLRKPIELAEGAPVGQVLAQEVAAGRIANMQPETLALFRPGGTPLPAGAVLAQPDLAKTFRLISEQGVDVFYEGEIAAAIVDAQRRLSPTMPIAGGEGRMTLADLAALRVTVERPLALDHRGARVLAPPPSTSGGLVLLEALGIYDAVRERHPDLDFGWGSEEAMHTTIESLRLALADRAMWIGDDDVVDVPVEGLLSGAYLRERSAPIDPLVGRIPNPELLPGNPWPYDALSLLTADAAADEGVGHTTHFSIVDKWGNAVAMTSTLADSFGSGILVPGYGFLLNDSLSLFNLAPAANAATGNPGANDAAPDKRPMGSMTPTIVVRDGEPVLVTGTYGGNFIPSLVLNVVANVVDHGMTVADAAHAPRMWAQVANIDLPSRNFGRNPGFPETTIQRLMDRGDQITRVTTPGFGSASSAGVDLAARTLVGASDRRQWADPDFVVIPRPS